MTEMKTVFLLAALLLAGCSVKNTNIDNCKLIEMRCQNECNTTKCTLKCVQKYNNCIGEKSKKNFAMFLYDLLSN